MANLRDYPQEMRDALDNFNIESNRLNDAFASDVIPKESPPLIYHYTNDVGLRGILEKGTIWLTDIFYLSDPSELRYGFSHAINALKSKADNGPPEINLLAKIFEDFDQKKGIEEPARYYVCSFSLIGDDLGQWRAYSDNGRGYALGFDTKVLEAAFMKNIQTPSQINATFPVTYKESKLVEKQRQLIESMFQFNIPSVAHGHTLRTDQLNTYLSDVIKILILHALYPSLHCKHEAYNNEQEYRFLQIHSMDSPPDLKLRSRSYALIPYREFDWRTIAPLALKKIIIGPAANKQKAFRFVRDCLRAYYDIDSVEVTDSKIPYRAL
jgi:hypothetical protein